METFAKPVERSRFLYITALTVSLSRDIFRC